MSGFRTERRIVLPRTGMTILELIVATGILAMLGGTLVLMLRQGLSTYRHGETRREAYEEAQAVADRLIEDLEHCFAQPRTAEGRAPIVRFYSDIDPHGRQRLVFTRRLSGEVRNPLTRHAGETLLAPARLDQNRDREEALQGLLRPTLGLAEVAWVFDADGGPVLRRGFRSPPGGAGSLFTRALDDIEALPRACRVFSERVLHLEVAFWTPYTNTWSFAHPPRRGGDKKSGPLEVWDSTRALLAPPPNPARDQFVLNRGRASLTETSDDIFPEKVKVTLVVREVGPGARRRLLMKNLDASADKIRISNSDGFPQKGYVRLDNEWIHYERKSGDRLIVSDGGRGARGTTPAPHEQGIDVETGRAFTFVVDLPMSRANWNE